LIVSDIFAHRLLVMFDHWGETGSHLQLLESHNLRELMSSLEIVDLKIVIVSLTCDYPDPAVLVSRRQTYCTGHSSYMGLSVFSAGDGLCTGTCR
jgi:hypothetical protein